MEIAPQAIDVIGEDKLGKVQIFCYKGQYNYNIELLLLRGKSMSSLYSFHGDVLLDAEDGAKGAMCIPA